MCEKDHFEDDLEEAIRSGRVTRRDFGGLAAGIGLAVVLPRAANAQAVTEKTVEIKTPDGTCDAHFAYPQSGAHAAVVVWPDILGLRPAFQQMGKRLAESGYSVLTVNPFYRSARAPVVPPGSAFDEKTRGLVFPMAQKLNATTHTSDATAFIAWLDQQPQVDKNRKVGTTGYCMGGPITMRTAAAVPNRVGAAASFHGGNLVTQMPDSPHLLVPQMKAKYLFAVAQNDDMRDPEAKNVLKDAFAKAKLDAEIEVYPAMHGWCPPDSQVYDMAQAEKAWSRMLALFERSLA
jgi:carboxymethylenebutenolidase